MILPRMRLDGADVLRPGGLVPADVVIDGGRIDDGPARRVVDLSGFLILPGIVDLHGDGFEHHVAPRRGAMKDVDQGLVATEAELAANGITTAVLAQFHSWEGGLRGPDFADRVFAALTRVGPVLATDLRPQLRFEIPLLADYDRLPDIVARHGIGYVVFNDHLPHDALAKGKRPPRLTGQALRLGRNPEAHLAMMQAMHAQQDAVRAALPDLAARLAGMGVRLGSHDDRSAADRMFWRGLGVRIAEFPETAEAAESARHGGDGIILGSPNLVRGGSHKGNASALDLVAMGYCDALASDYHYPSLKRAAFLLADGGITDLARAWDLISGGPARMLGLTDRGEIVAGKRADLVILEPETRRIGATIAGGAVSYMTREVAARLIG